MPKFFEDTMNEHNQAGFRVLPMPAPIPADILDAYANIVTSHISDSMQRICGVQGLRPYHAGKRLVGRAITVKVRPGDNMMIHKAMDMAAPGDVIVVDASGDVTQALIGELMQIHAEVRGIAGFVIDGAVRDIGAFRAADFPCYARGNTHRGPFKEGPGEVNVPVTIGGLVINAGDLIVGDEDGVVAVPADQWTYVLGKAREQAAREEQRKTAIRAGKDKREWIDERLRKLGVIA